MKPLMVSWSSVTKDINALNDAANKERTPENILRVLFDSEVSLKYSETMTRKEAQARISSGLSVHIYFRDSQQRQQRYEIKSIGLTICHSIDNRRFDNRSVEFGI
jgi:hypothetical protein